MRIAELSSTTNMFMYGSLKFQANNKQIAVAQADRAISAAYDVDIGDFR